MSPLPTAVRRCRRVAAALVTTVALLALAAPRASAALPITFDGLAAGADVTNQFPEATFLDPDGSAGSHSEVPVAADVGARQAHSGTKVALSACFACEFEHHVMLVQLSQRAETASVRLGFAGGSTTTPRPIRVEALGPDMNVLTSTTAHATAAGYRTLAHLDPPSGTIAFLRLRTIDRSAEGERFGIDDLTYTSAAAAAPDFAVVARTAGVTVRPGGSATFPVDVLRFNGSSGPVTLSTSSLPPGVTARTITPNPVRGSANASATVTLDASTGTPNGRFEPQVAAVPGESAVGPATRTDRFDLTVEKAFDVSLPTRIDMAPCATKTVRVAVSRARSGFTAPIRLAVGALPAGYEATLGATTVTNPADGGFDTSVPLTIRAARAGLPAPNVTVIASSAGLPDQRATRTVGLEAGAITSMAPDTGSVPQVLRPGTLVELRGTGFCPGDRVEFGAARAQADGVEVDSAAGRIRARVPRLATSGPLRVVSRDRTMTTPGSFTVISPRNSEGFSFRNYDHPGVNHSIVEELYGKEETNISVNPCWPFDCTIATPIPSPLTALYIAASNLVLEDEGSCFGIAVTSQHIATGVSPLSRYERPGAGSVWELQGPEGPAPALARRIRTWHTAQLSAQFLGHWARSSTLNAADRGRASRATLRSELRAGRNPLVSIRKGRKGHVVVAHDMVEKTDGSYEIHVYDPNFQFLSTENDAGGDHAKYEDSSIIDVFPNGEWTRRRSDWKGTAATMVVTPLDVLSGGLDMPTDPDGLVTLVTPFSAGAADVSQVSDDRGRTLLGPEGDVNRDPRTRIPGATMLAGLSGDGAAPVYLLDPGGAYTQELRGVRTGTAETAVIGPGFAAHVSGLNTRAGAVDRVRTAAGAVQVDASSGGGVHLRLGRGLTSGIEASADLRVSGGGRGRHDVRLDPRGRGGLRYENDGRRAATVRATLSGAAADGLPGSVRLGTIRVPAGGRVDARPTSWSALGESHVGIRVRDARGAVVSRRTIVPRAGKWIGRVRLSARTREGDRRIATVRVDFRGVPRGAMVTVGVRARRGGKTVAGESRSAPVRAGTRRATYHFPITLPRGRYTLRADAAVFTRGDGSRATARRRFRAQ